MRVFSWKMTFRRIYHIFYHHHGQFTFHYTKIWTYIFYQQYQQLCDSEKALKFITFNILPAAEWRKVLLSKLRIAFIHAKYSHSWNSLCSKSCASNDYSLSIVPWNFPKKKIQNPIPKKRIFAFQILSLLLINYL